ncbi:hypothetical protein M422DRAFT_239426 [Sphaerobolus stellatus SS14]|nr:hypothetical protein M422DRAFT_239426 [Sphaerobolus stellatus SS14]
MHIFMTNSNAQSASKEEPSSDTAFDETDGTTEISQSHEGGTIKCIDELEAALHSDDFNFTGSFSYASGLPTAPNPCLVIDGLGPIRLPLSTGAAESLVECAGSTPAAEGRWEIGADKIKSHNKDYWEPFVRDLALDTVCEALGVVVADDEDNDELDSKPRYELDRLLLYEAGSDSHFLSDTQTPEGTFATMLILLPSWYTGGSIRISHGPKSETYDFFEDSMSSTSVLSWYTSATHTLSPLTSGYRLALSYKLITTRVPKPVFPEMTPAITSLRRVLKKWKENTYDEDDMPKNKFIGYLLSNDYDDESDVLGPSSLRGEDAHKLSYLKPIADELGYKIYLGQLQHYELGQGERINFDDDSAFGYRRPHKRRRCDSYDSDSDSGSDSGLGAEDFVMEEVYVRNTTVRFLVGLEGHRAIGQPLNIEEMKLDHKCDIIPRDAFDGVEPDNKICLVDPSLCDAELEYQYDRTILILIRNEDVLTILCSEKAGGFKYGLERLKRLNHDSPTDEDRALANAMIASIRPEIDGETNTPQHCGPAALKNAKVMVDYAFKWGEPEIWVSVMKNVVGREFLNKVCHEEYFRAWNQFSFEDIEAGFSATLLSIPALKDRLDFIDRVQEYASQNNKSVNDQDWYRTQLIVALSTCDPEKISFSDQDAHLLVNLARKWDLPFVDENALEPLSKKHALYGFWVTLVKALVENKQYFVDVPNSQENSESHWPNSCSASEFNAVLDRCFNVIIPRWKDVLPVFYYPAQPNIDDTAKIDRIIQTCELGALAGRMPDVCCRVLNALIVDKTVDVPSRFKTLYNPLIPKLHNFMQSHNLTFTSPPFDSFARNLISLYLHFVLRGKDTGAPIRKIGCDCADCENLDRFMANSKREKTFRMSLKRRLHLESQLRSSRGSEYCQWTMIGSGLNVIKNADFLASLDWETRKAEASGFLGSLGYIENLRAVMGPRWIDVMTALHGIKSFCLDHEPGNGSSQLGLASVFNAMLNEETTSVERKRKRALESTTPGGDD